MGSTTSSPDTPLGPGAILAFLRRHRQRLARVLSVLIIALAFAQLSPRVPRESELEFALGPNHGDIVELRVAYVQDGQVFKGARFDFPHGAPRSVTHRVSLPAGDFEARVDLLCGGAPGQRIVRAWHSPAEGRLRLLLQGDPP